MSRNRGASRRAERRESASARQAAYDKLTTQERINELDRSFGKGQGAARQRTKLQQDIQTEQDRMEKAATKAAAKVEKREADRMGGAEKAFHNAKVAKKK